MHWRGSVMVLWVCALAELHCEIKRRGDDVTEGVPQVFFTLGARDIPLRLSEVSKG